MAHNSSICIGLFLSFLFGGVLPDPEDTVANEEDEMWRVIWLGPVAIGIFTILMTLFVMRLEPVAYCMMTGRNTEGCKHLAKIYRKKQPDSDEKIEDILGSQYTSLRSSTALDASTVTSREAICGTKYRKGTFVACMINFFNQSNGLSAILIYANRLLVKMQEDGGADEFPLTPIQGTYLVGASNMVFALLVIFYIERVGRKPILIVGHFFMTVFLFLCGLGIKNSWNMTSFVMILLFVGSF